MSWLSRFTQSSAPQPEEAVVAAAPIEVPPDTAVVLLVEDEPAVRGLFANSLRKDGYFVLEASNGAEALSVVEKAGKVDLVVTDVVMPVMKGTELASRLRERFPSLRFIFVSGYVVQDELGPNSELLQKPFVRQDLIRRVANILGPATSPAT